MKTIDSSVSGLGRRDAYNDIPTYCLLFLLVLEFRFVEVLIIDDIAPPQAFARALESS